MESGVAALVAKHGGLLSSAQPGVLHTRTLCHFRGSVIHVCAVVYSNSGRLLPLACPKVRCPQELNPFDMGVALGVSQTLDGGMVPFTSVKPLACPGYHTTLSCHGSVIPSTRAPGTLDVDQENLEVEPFRPGASAAEAGLPGQLRVRTNLPARAGCFFPSKNSRCAHSKKKRLLRQPPTAFTHGSRQEARQRATGGYMIVHCFRISFSFSLIILRISCSSPRARCAASIACRRAAHHR